MPTCSGEFDLIVTGAELIDGLGTPAVRADIGLREKRIACIGTFDLEGQKIMDATGLTVAPGFIDVHTHIERNVPTKSPFVAQNFVRQGVTTLITGNCGRSFLNIGAFYKQLEANGADVNVASLVGHNTIRSEVMNESATAPTPAQLNSMKKLTAAAMQEGALGLSTGLEYIPGAFARIDELVDLAKVVSLSDGMYVSHLRDEADKGEQAIQEAITIGERARIHIHFSHFKTQGPNQWGTAQHRLNLLKLAKDKGLRVSLDQYPYSASSTGVVVLIPSWLSDGGLNAARKKLSEPATRNRVRQEMLAELKSMGWKDYSFARVAYYQFDHSLVGLTIKEIVERQARTRSLKDESAAKANVKPVSTTSEKSTSKSKEKITSRQDFKMAHMIPSKPTPSEIEREADVIIDMYSHGGAQMVFFGMSDADVETIMKDPDVMFGSDSSVREESTTVLPHPRGMGTFPRVLGVYAAEKKLFPLEDAVRRMTSLPAATFGLANRGQLQNGYWADLVIFDRERIHDTATYDNPLSVPEGIVYVLVNGEVVLDHGVLTKSKPGMALRRDRTPHQEATQ